MPTADRSNPPRLSQDYPPLDQETRAAVPTDCAAHHLSRQPQTLRKWALVGGVGNLRPFRINGRLMWPTAAIREVLEVPR